MWKWYLQILLCICCILSFSQVVHAEPASSLDSERESQKESVEETTKEIQDTLLEKEEFSMLEEKLQNLIPEEQFDFKSLTVLLMKGKIKEVLQTLGKGIKAQALGEVQGVKKSLLYILGLAIVASLLFQFSHIFENRQAMDMSFFVIYMLLITICLKCFMILLESATQGIQNMLDFMKVLGPAFFLAVTVAKGNHTSIGFYSVLLLLIYLVEWLTFAIILPMIHGYVIVNILDQFSNKSYLTKTSEALELAVKWILKILLAGMIGLNFIQSLISPCLDAIQRNVVIKGVESIPVVGDAASGTAETILSISILLKNAVGVVGVLLCIFICCGPVLKMGIVTLMFKVTAAVIQPISDKRMVNSVSKMGDGCGLLLKAYYTIGVLFLLTIGVAAAA